MRSAVLPPLITAFLYLATGLFVLRQLRRPDKNALAYSLWLFTTVYWQLGWAIVFSLKNTTWIPFLVRLNYCGIVFIPIAFYHLFTNFLNTRREVRWLRLAYGIGCLFAIACWIDGWMVDGFYTYRWGFYARAGQLHPLYLVFLSVIVARILFLLFQDRRFEESTSLDRMQLKLLRWAFIGYLPAASDFGINYGLPYYPIGFIFTLISLGLVSYAIVEHHLFDIRLIIRKTLVYSAVTLVLSVIYVSLLVLITRSLEAWGVTSNFYSSAAAAAVIAILVYPVRSWIQQGVDRHFPREALGHALLREATSSFVHEIKHPLVNISLPAQLALSDLDRLESEVKVHPAEFKSIRERLDFILKQSHEAADKIEAIRELSMGEALSKEPIDLGQILRRALASEDLRLKKAEIEVRTTIPSDFPCVSGNGHQLEIALVNIIRNAGDAMQTLPVGQRVLSCDLQVMNDHLVIRITDSGPGIQPKNLERLFDPWFSTKGSHGMGIGLYLTQEIIHRHAGSIEARNEKGSGSTFQIILPLKS